MKSARQYAAQRKSERNVAKSLSGKGWFHIGDVGVDTGTVMICDPCNAEEIKDQLDVIDAGLGVLVKSGDGDGIYPVFARYENGVTAEVRIMFVEGEVPHG
jgi:hypothetical protein